MDISILIVNYNTDRVTAQAIDKILQQQGIKLEVIVVDNASQDDSLSLLEKYADQIHLIASPENLGYGKANNLAARQAQGRYLCIINPDSMFDDDQSLSKLIAYMDENPRIGLCGVNLVNDDGTPEKYNKAFYPGGRHYRRHFDALPGEIAWVYGAMMFVRRDIFDRVKGFDEDYFLHGEDADLCIRVRKAGFVIGFLDSVTVRHIGAVSYRKIDPYLTKTRKIKGAFIFFRKHYPPSIARRLIRLKYRKALVRLIALKISRGFSDNEKKAGKYIRYKAVYDLARQYLRES